MSAGVHSATPVAGRTHLHIIPRFLFQAPGRLARPGSTIRTMAKRPQTNPPQVGVIMGSQSDWSVMETAALLLKEFGVPHEVRIVSAHRTPDRLYRYASDAAERGLKVIIAGAGGAAHLPGMVAAMTTLPVLGVPIPATSLQGLDSLLSIVQMPGGVPVGTLAIGKPGAVNAALLAAQILALSDPALAKRVAAWRAERTDSVADAPSPAKPPRARAK